jgi:hypothetical protein
VFHITSSKKVYLPALATGFFSASLAFRCSFRVFPFCGVLEAELPGDEEDAPETVPVPPSFFVLTGWAEPGTKSCAATWGFILGFLLIEKLMVQAGVTVS